MRRDTLLGKEEEKRINIEQEIKAIGQTRITDYMYPFDNPIYLDYPKELVQNVQYVLSIIKNFYPNLNDAIANKIVNYVVSTSQRRDGTFDGIYGYGTAMAVYLFQDAVIQRKATGLLDEETLQYLGMWFEPYVSLLRNSQEKVLAQLSTQPSTPTLPTITQDKLQKWMQKYGIWIGIGIVAIVGIILIASERSKK